MDVNWQLESLGLYSNDLTITFTGGFVYCALCYILAETIRWDIHRVTVT